jgi:hypothetical protein
MQDFTFLRIKNIICSMSFVLLFWFSYRDVDAVGGPVVLDPSYFVSLAVDLLVF